MNKSVGTISKNAFVAQYIKTNEYALFDQYGDDKIQTYHTDDIFCADTFSTIEDIKEMSKWGIDITQFRFIKVEFTAKSSYMI